MYKLLDNDTRPKVGIFKKISFCEVKTSRQTALKVRCVPAECVCEAVLPPAALLSLVAQHLLAGPTLIGRHINER